MLWLAMVLSLTTVLLSGRRALLLLVLVAPPLTLLLRAWLSESVKRESRRWVRRVVWTALALTVILVVIMTAIGAMAPEGFVDMVASGFRFNSDAVAMSRRDMFFGLINGWLEQPLFGSGHGASVRGVIRAVDTPWAYELSYVALLYHTGVVGFVAYSAGPFWTFVKSRQIVRTGWPESPYLVATLVGTACFLLANATNPYLEKYDSIWIVFLPIAFINVWLIERGKGAGLLRHRTSSSVGSPIA
jgi:hypothetical protein